LKTPSSASLFSPWARRTRKAWNVCAHEAMTFVTCWLTERRSEIVTPRILIVCTRAMSGRVGIRETWLFLLWRVIIISTDLERLSFKLLEQFGSLVPVCLPGGQTVASFYTVHWHKSSFGTTGQAINLVAGPKTWNALPKDVTSSQS